MSSSQCHWLLLEGWEEPHYCRSYRIYQDYSYICDPFFQEFKCQAEKRKNKSAVDTWHNTLKSFKAEG